MIDFGMALTIEQAMPLTDLPQSFEDVCLYIIVRTDLDSMNNGKACAQSTHAANQCVYDIRRSNNHFLHAQLVAWEGNRGFGRCVVLGAESINSIRYIVEKLVQHNHHAAVTHDETYPVRDGNVTHLIPVDTCAYVFGLKHLLDPFLSHLPLLP